MTYCSNCGEKIPDDAFFCSKCGHRTPAGFKANVGTPSEEVREAFNKISVELEKAFNVAAKEVHQAFQQARANIQKSTSEEPIVCSSCGEKNPGNAVFCHKCGNKLVS
jgi:ribosomal protein L40E